MPTSGYGNSNVLVAHKSRLKENEKYSCPGPGDYGHFEDRTTKFRKAPSSSWAASKGSRFNPRPKHTSPGPNTTYGGPKSSLLSRQNKFGTGERDLNLQAPVPGPGTYAPEAATIHKPKIPTAAFSGRLGKRERFCKIQNKHGHITPLPRDFRPPGPGTYQHQESVCTIGGVVAPPMGKEERFMKSRLTKTTVFTTEAGTLETLQMKPNFYETVHDRPAPGAYESSKSSFGQQVTSNWKTSVANSIGTKPTREPEKGTPANIGPDSYQALMKPGCQPQSTVRNPPMCKFGTSDRLPPNL